MSVCDVCHKGEAVVGAPVPLDVLIEAPRAEPHQVNLLDIDALLVLWGHMAPHNLLGMLSVVVDEHARTSISP